MRYALVALAFCISGCGLMWPSTDVTLSHRETKIDAEGKSTIVVERSATIHKGAFASDTNVTWELDPKTGLFKGSWIASNDPTQALQAASQINAAMWTNIGTSFQTLAAIGGAFAPRVPQPIQNTPSESVPSPVPIPIPDTRPVPSLPFVNP